MLKLSATSASFVAAPIIKSSLYSKPFTLAFALSIAILPSRHCCQVNLIFPGKVAAPLMPAPKATPAAPAEATL